jgi:hypothetical protein
MRLFLIGDVHGLFVDYNELLKSLPKGCRSIQLGDMGYGFGQKWDVRFPKYRFHKFIRGNHDNPAACAMLDQCLSDYGYLKQFNLFYVAGGFSIDRAYRVEGQSWWPDEELSQRQFQNAFNRYVKTKPEIVISHDCPVTVYPMMVRGGLIRNSTASALGAMLREHQPKLWVFGHHHKSVDFEYGPTRFVCLKELEVFEVPQV